MPKLIIELLQGRPADAHELYLALNRSGNKDRNKDGGLGSVFHKATGIDLVDEAFIIDDKKQTAEIHSITALYKLAQIFYGRPAPPPLRAKPQNFVGSNQIYYMHYDKNKTLNLNEVAWESYRLGCSPILILHRNEFFLYGNTTGKHWQLTPLAYTFLSLENLINGSAIPASTPGYYKLKEEITKKAAHTSGYLYEHIQINFNPNKYAICLALICYFEHRQEKITLSSTSKQNSINLQHTLTALRELNELFNAGTLKDSFITLEMRATDFLQAKITAYEQLINQSCVSSSQIKAAGAGFKISTYPTETVTLTIANVKKEFVRKRGIPRDVAELEVFSGTMMELYIGPHQPSTLQENNGISDTTAVLSEKIVFHTFLGEKVVVAHQKIYNFSGLNQWASQDFNGAAEIDIACIQLAEADFHINNGGMREDTHAAMRFDFDRTIAPLTLPYKLQHWSDTSAIQIIRGVQNTIAGVSAVTAYEIHPDDLKNSPLLQTTFLPQHFIPPHWWTHSYPLPENLKNKIKALPQQPDYQYRKHRAILEKIIMPDEIIKNIADAVFFNLARKTRLLDWMMARKQKMLLAAVQLPEFIEFIHQHGAHAVEALKQRYQQFVDKRKDLIFPQSPAILFKLYDHNFQTLLNSYPFPEAQRPRQLAIPDSPMPSVVTPELSTPPPSPEPFVAYIAAHPTVSAMLTTMEYENFPTLHSEPQENQRDYFLQEITKLTIDELAALSEYMHDVQQGREPTHPFGAVRLKTSSCCDDGTGNTETWRTMRHAVKTTLIQKVQQQLQPEPNTKAFLSRDEYEKYYRLMNQNTGHWYGRPFATSSARFFKSQFRVATTDEEAVLTHGYRQLNG